MKPTTCYLADDGTVFLPVGNPTAVLTFCGHDKAFKACAEHEKKLCETKERNNGKERTKTTGGAGD